MSDDKMKIKIKVSYPAPLIEELDKKIEKLMKSIGADWYAQGTDLTTNIREILFDKEIKDV